MAHSFQELLDPSQARELYLIIALLYWLQTQKWNTAREPRIFWSKRQMSRGQVCFLGGLLWPNTNNHISSVSSCIWNMLNLEPEKELQTPTVPEDWPLVSDRLGCLSRKAAVAGPSPRWTKYNSSGTVRYMFWLVVWNICYFSIYGMSSFPLTNSYFSRWLLHHQTDICLSKSDMTLTMRPCWSLNPRHHHPNGSNWFIVDSPITLW